jgi:predicted anti-sigma-YlaC factor YlaD
MMNCREITTSASDYIEHRLNPRTRMAMLLHLAMCRGCRAYINQFRLAIQGLRTLGASQHLDQSVDPRLLEQFRRASRHQND